MPCYDAYGRASYEKMGESEADEAHDGAPRNRKVGAESRRGIGSALANGVGLGLLHRLFCVNCAWCVVCGRGLACCVTCRYPAAIVELSRTGAGSMG